MLNGKKILIGVTGSIAAYKIPLLVRLLVKEQADVQLIVTEASKDFVTPLTLSTLSGKPVLSDFFSSEDGTWNSHVELGNWADLFLIAPVSATTLGKMANGIADNLLVATYLAAKCPVYLAPAMDVDMYQHPSTSRNIEILKSFGNKVLEPAIGELASGLHGPGRMQEPEEILEFLKLEFQKKKSFLNKKVLITAGPTYENIDPVRFIGNYSSGKMGYAVAEAFAREGADVQLVSGPVSIQTESKSVNVSSVKSAKEMYEACMKLSRDADIIVMSAAVADYTPKETQSEKIKKKSNSLQIDLKPTRDILKALGENKSKGQILIGFALETANELENAKKKLKNKNLDFIVLNSLNNKGAGFGGDSNKISIIDHQGVRHFDLKSKQEVAEDILDKIKSIQTS